MKEKDLKYILQQPIDQGIPIEQRGIRKPANTVVTIAKPVQFYKHETDRSCIFMGVPDD